MTTAVPTRRERRRSATITEIKQVARRLVVDHGPSAISLRAIGRELGMSAAALYRYFPSLEALVKEICSDVFDELRDAIMLAGSTTDPAPTGSAADERLPMAAPTGCAADELSSMARGFRRWSIAHPQDFALLFGTPVPGVAELEEECVSPDHPGALFGAVFAGPFGRLWAELHQPASDHDDELRRLLGPMYQAYGDGLPPAAMHAMLIGWIRLYGVVAMEVFGHLRWAVDDVEPLFEAELAAFIQQLALRDPHQDPASPRLA